MKRLNDTLSRILHVLLTVLMGLLIVPIVLQIASRFITAMPHFIWTEEIARFCFIWVIMIGAMRDRLSYSDLWLIVPFLILALSATRAVAPAWIALTPVLASAAAWARRRFGRGFPVPIAIILSLLILAGPFLLGQPVVIDESRFPVSAGAHLDPSLRTFHDDVAGGYFTYRGLLQDGVFIDDRVELFRSRIDEFVEIRNGRPGWRQVFARDGIQQALLGVDDPLRYFLEAEGWRTYYRDDSHAVMRPG